MNAETLTDGKGGVGGNARGVKEYYGSLFAAMNSGSGNVAMFTRAGGQLVFEQLVSTTSPPVSIDFANGHMKRLATRRILVIKNGQLVTACPQISFTT